MEYIREFKPMLDVFFERTYVVKFFMNSFITDSNICFVVVEFNWKLWFTKISLKTQKMKEKQKETRILEKKREKFGESGLAGLFSSAGHPCLFFIILVIFFRN